MNLERTDGGVRVPVFFNSSASVFFHVSQTTHAVIRKRVSADFICGRMRVPERRKFGRENTRTAQLCRKTNFTSGELTEVSKKLRKRKKNDGNGYTCLEITGTERDRGDEDRGYMCIDLEN